MAFPIKNNCNFLNLNMVYDCDYCFAIKNVFVVFLYYHCFADYQCIGVHLMKIVYGGVVFSCEC